MDDRGQTMDGGLPPIMMTLLIIAVVGWVAYKMVGRIVVPTDPVHVAVYLGFAVLLAFLARGVWILYQSGNARIEQKKAEVKAREGRNPAGARTYHQDVEAQAIAYIAKIPIVGRIFVPFQGGKE